MFDQHNYGYIIILKLFTYIVKLLIKEVSDVDF